MASLTLQETMDRLHLLICAGYPVIYIVSHEETRVLDYLAKIYRSIKAERPLKNFLHWYDGLGLQSITNLTAQNGTADCAGWLALEGLPPQPVRQGYGNQHAWEALNSIQSAQMDGFAVLADSLTVFFDIHQYLRSDMSLGGTSLVRPLRNTADKLRRYYDTNRPVSDSTPDSTPEHRYKTIVIVAPSAFGLSMELERDLIVIDFPLPEAEELQLTLKNMISKNVLRFPDPIPDQERMQLCGSSATDAEYKSRLCDLIASAGRGLTLEDYKLGLNMFAVRHEPLSIRHIEDMLHLKAKAINNQALKYTPHVDISLGGLKEIREWVNVRRDPVVSHEVRQKYHLPSPKGVMLCGVSGGGKSQLAKLIAKEFNLALLRLDVGALFGMYVGESEERTRVALQLAEVLAPIVLWIDEIDKAFTGIGGGDNGVSARVFGHFLTWLAEKKDSVFVVATANDFRGLLKQFPEFGRKGRFDEIFWVKLPDQNARQEIFKIYLETLLDKAHFRVTSEQVQELAHQHNISGVPHGVGELESFCWLLSHPTISQNLTGAEIEYAITEALYKAYELDRTVGETNTFTPTVIVNTVQASQHRALYRAGTPDAATLQDLQQDAQDKNWLFVG